MQHIKLKGFSFYPQLLVYFLFFMWEFAIEHDLKWLERWKMTYYGCCEPLAGKGHLLKKISNLRKVSFSPWNNTKKLFGRV